MLVQTVEVSAIVARIALMIQAAASAPIADLVNDPRLKSLPPPCAPPTASGDVVVCGRKGESPYRLGPMSSETTQENLIPEARVGLRNGGSIDMHVEQKALGLGTVSNRLMVGIKLPF